MSSVLAPPHRHLHWAPPFPCVADLTLTPCLYGNTDIKAPTQTWRCTFCPGSHTAGPHSTTNTGKHCHPLTYQITESLVWTLTLSLKKVCLVQPYDKKMNLTKKKNEQRSFQLYILSLVCVNNLNLLYMDIMI